MEITVTNLSKSFDGRKVFSQVSQTFRTGDIYCLMGTSGSGKTTFFRILLGLDQPDSGTVSGTEGAFLSAVFQENRLCESFSSLDNVLMVFPKVTKEIREAVKEDLCKLLPEESIYRPVSGRWRCHLTRSSWMNRLPVWMRTHEERSSNLSNRRQPESWRLSVPIRRRMSPFWAAV